MRRLTAAIVLTTLNTFALAAEVTHTDWPREIETDRGLIVIYQPQPETLDGNRLRFRTAMSLEQPGQDPVFGAVWFEARLETNRAERSALITDLTVVDTRFPNQDDERIALLSELLETEIPKWNLPIEMDELIATLDLSEIQAAETANVRVDPPVMLFLAEPAVLITLDGEPRYIDT